MWGTLSVLVFYNSLITCKWSFLTLDLQRPVQQFILKCHLCIWPDLCPLPHWLHFSLYKFAENKNSINHPSHKRRCIISCHKYTCSNRYRRISKRRTPTMALERLPGSRIYLSLLHSIDDPTSSMQLKSGIQGLLLNGEVTYGSLYLVVWVIFHYFYKN